MVVHDDVDVLDWTRKDGGGEFGSTPWEGRKRGLRNTKLICKTVPRISPLDVTMWNPFQQLDNCEARAADSTDGIFKFSVFL